MPRKRYTEEQIAAILKEAETGIATVELRASRLLPGKIPLLGKCYSEQFCFHRLIFAIH